jgi:hypothetical protein
MCFATYSGVLNKRFPVNPTPQEFTPCHHPSCVLVICSGVGLGGCAWVVGISDEVCETCVESPLSIDESLPKGIESNG